MPQPAASNANEYIEGQLREGLAEIEKKLNADALVFCGPIAPGADDVIRRAVEQRSSRRKRLAVILETAGGYIEVAQRIADTLRHHYGRVDFIIPNYAMSAGTVLVMSGDAIWMDYYSVLGPIDPQVQRRGGGTLIPALGYLVQYERLVEKSRKGTLTTAEATFLIEKFDPAELYRYEQERELSISLLKEWLVRYKFKNWRRTETRGLPVTRKMREQRAARIAADLNNTEMWHSHSRGISMTALRNTLKLRIEDLGDDPDLNDAIKVYYRLLIDYMRKLGQSGVLHTTDSYVPLTSA